VDRQRDAGDEPYLTFDLLPLTDPLVLLQSLLARHAPELTALVGAGIVLATYLVLGGRLYRSWVCPINAVTDLALFARHKPGLETGWKVKPEVRKPFSSSKSM
jgi:ferredoxin-type protein NapH